MNVFSERLKQLRNDAGLNQSELGEKLNCQRTRIADLERGKTTPTPEDITILCKTFNVSSDYLLGLSDVATADVDIKDICEYTGLSIDAVQKLHHSKTLRSRIPEPESETTYLDTVNWILTDTTVHKSIMNVFWYKTNLHYLIQDQKELLKYAESTDFIKIDFIEKCAGLKMEYRNVRFFLFEALENFRTAVAKDSEAILNEYIENEKLLQTKDEFCSIQLYNAIEDGDSECPQ